MFDLFEQFVMNVIARDVGRVERAYFYDGSLFIEDSENVARRVFHALNRVLENKVQVSVVAADAEYAFDFVE